MYGVWNHDQDSEVPGNRGPGNMARNLHRYFPQGNVVFVSSVQKQSLRTVFSVQKLSFSTVFSVQRAKRQSLPPAFSVQETSFWYSKKMRSIFFENSDT